ncbi:hypothetical protein ZIOFF_043579 [Zingiber officinale]|uniref:Aminoacyl-tRNA synthetase class Ia domain-containing protein n=1 Tax=Zingiber officinale TaxID=94328 RepID=A0A8J5GAU3_ZINOF|nr:hypothetical protein ZIOFF_043579 [Zingiber officinale]
MIPGDTVMVESGFATACLEFEQEQTSFYLALAILFLGQITALNPSMKCFSFSDGYPTIMGTKSILRASSREMLVFKLSRVLNLLIPFSIISNINLDFSDGFREDTIIRWRRMSSYNVLWVIGMDLAGIAIQVVVLFIMLMNYLQGAAWLHGVCNENPLASWIGRLGLPIYRTSGDNSVLYDHDLESYALFDGDGHQVPQDLVEKVGKVEFEGLGELRSKDEEDEGLGELRSKDEEDEGI